jgi:hypothetical protein
MIKAIQNVRFLDKGRRPAYQSKVRIAEVRWSIFASFLLALDWSWLATGQWRGDSCPHHAKGKIPPDSRAVQERRRAIQGSAEATGTR